MGKVHPAPCTLLLQLPVGLQLPLAFVCVYLPWLGCKIATLHSPVCPSVRVSIYANAGDNCAANIA